MVTIRQLNTSNANKQAPKKGLKLSNKFSKTFQKQSKKPKLESYYIKKSLNKTLEQDLLTVIEQPKQSQEETKEQEPFQDLFEYKKKLKDITEELMNKSSSLFLFDKFNYDSLGSNNIWDKLAPKKSFDSTASTNASFTNPYSPKAEQ